MILILLMYMVLASTFTIGKAALFYVQPIFFIGIRMMLAGALLLCYLVLFKRELLTFKKEHARLFASLIVFHIYCAYVLEFVALAHISSAKVCLLYNLSPFITALFAYYFFAEQLSRQQWIGLIIGFLGFIPILISCVPSEGPSLLCISWAECLLLGSVVSSVIGWMVVKQMVRYNGYSPLCINAIAMFFGGLLALGTSIAVEAKPFIYNKPDAFWMVGIYTALAIITANFIFYNAYGFLLRRYSATFLSFVGFTCPLFAALYGWLFLQEVIPGSFFLSIAIVIVGLYLFYQEEMKPL